MSPSSRWICATWAPSPCLTQMSQRDILVWGKAIVLPAAFPKIPITKTCPVLWTPSLGLPLPSQYRDQSDFCLWRLFWSIGSKKREIQTRLWKPKARCNTGTCPWLGRACTAEWELWAASGATAAAGSTAWGLYNDPVICHFPIYWKAGSAQLRFQMCIDIWVSKGNDAELTPPSDCPYAFWYQCFILLDYTESTEIPMALRAS